MTNVEKIKEIAKEYLTLDKNPKTSEDIERLLNEEDYQTLDKLLSKRMTFGTAGLRAEMGSGYSRMNDLTIIQSTQGLCSYLLQSKNSAKYNSVVIGYDHRHNSKNFATLAAGIFNHKGVTVYYYNDIVHTPMVPYAVKKLKADVGIMITASHNPKQDNGYKVYWNNACQIIPPHDKGIADSILDNLIPWVWNYDTFDRNDGVEEVSYLIDDYFNDLKSYSRPQKQKLPSNEKDCSSLLKFVYTAMHGVGYKFAKRAFETFNLNPFYGVELQINPDPDFPTVEFPNPEEGKGALKLAMETASKSGARIILANDPDADRLAVAEQQPDGEWYIFSGNELGTLLGCFIWQDYRESFTKGQDDSGNDDVYMLASTVSSKMLEKVAKDEGFSFEDTLTGFKWIGNRALTLVDQGKKVLFGFEEAIGFMIGDIVRDKDGISAMCVLAENATKLFARSQSLKGYLMELYEKYGYFVTENSYYICHDADTISRIFRRIRGLPLGSDQGVIDNDKLEYPKTIGGHKVTGIRDLTVGYDSSFPDFKPRLPVSRSSEMITFRLENGTVITLRTSGTEPKIKYYSELGGGSSLESARADLCKIIGSFCQDLLEPAKNGLIARKE